MYGLAGYKYIYIYIYGLAGFLGFGHSAKHAHFFLKIACSVNFLVDRGGDSFVRSEVRVFTLFFGSESFFVYI